MNGLTDPRSLISRVKFSTSLIPFSVLIIYCLSQSTRHGVHDFSNSYFPAYFFSTGELGTWVFEPVTFNKKIESIGIAHVFGSFNPNPPSIAIFFYPLTLLKPITAKLVFSIFSAIFFVISLYRLCEYLAISPSSIFLALPFVFFTPIRNNMLFGQSYLLLFAILAEGVIAYEKGEVLSSSCWWCLAIFIKIFPAILFIFLFSNKAYKNILVLGGLCLSFLAIFIGIQGVELWSDYLLRVLPRAGQGELHSAFTTATQSAHMLFKYLFQEDSLLNAQPFYQNSYLYIMSTSVFASIVLAICFQLNIGLKKGFIGFCFTLLTAQLLSPQGSSYSNVLLLFIVLVSYTSIYDKFSIFTLVIVILISNIPIHYFQSLPIVFRFPRFFLLLILFLFIALKEKFKLNLAVVFALLALVAIPKFLLFKSERDPSTTLIDYEMRPLIFDYKIIHGLLSYTYWGIDGEKKALSSEKVSHFSLEGVRITNNQVFYNGIQLTNSTDKKLKPSIINNKYIIYLSDKGKGMGFYSIRKISINEKI